MHIANLILWIILLTGGSYLIIGVIKTAALWIKLERAWKLAGQKRLTATITRRCTIYDEKYETIREYTDTEERFIDSPTEAIIELERRQFYDYLKEQMSPTTAYDIAYGTSNAFALAMSILDKVVNWPRWSANLKFTKE